MGVAVIALAVVTIGSLIFWNRRKQRRAVVELQMNRDDSLAANAFLEEAEYHISIIKDPQN